MRAGLRFLAVRGPPAEAQEEHKRGVDGSEHGVAVIGVRDRHGRDHIAPSGDLEVDDSFELLYIATRPVIPASRTPLA